MRRRVLGFSISLLLLLTGLYVTIKSLDIRADKESIWTGVRTVYADPEPDVANSTTNATLPHRNTIDTLKRGSEERQPIRALVGVFSTISNSKKRNILRMGYRQFLRSYGGDCLHPDDLVDIRFVVAQPATLAQQQALIWEIDEYNDIIMLDSTENIDDGKTLDFFEHVAQMSTFRPFLNFNGYRPVEFGISAVPLIPRDGQAGYEYVLKVDDDSYMHFGNVMNDLRRYKGQNEVYWGRDCSSYELPTHVRQWQYACGLGYGLSWDLVDWLATSDIPRNDIHSVTPWEDAAMGYWLLIGGKTSNYQFKQMEIFNYDFRQIREDGLPGKWAPLSPDSMIVHNLKGNQLWAEVALWFDLYESTGFEGPQPTASYKGEV